MRLSFQGFLLATTCAVTTKIAVAQTLPTPRYEWNPVSTAVASWTWWGSGYGGGSVPKDWYYWDSNGIRDSTRDYWPSTYAVAEFVFRDNLVENRVITLKGSGFSSPIRISNLITSSSFTLNQDSAATNFLPQAFTTQFGTLTVNAVVGGTTLTKSGAGTVVLAGENTFSGALSVGQGVVEVLAPSGLGTGAANSAATGTTVQVGATLRFASAFTASTTVTERIAVGGTGISGNNAIELNPGAKVNSSADLWVNSGQAVIDLEGSASDMKVTGYIQSNSKTAKRKLLIAGNGRFQYRSNKLKNVSLRFAANSKARFYAYDVKKYVPAAASGSSIVITDPPALDENGLPFDADAQSGIFGFEGAAPTGIDWSDDLAEFGTNESGVYAAELETGAATNRFALTADDIDTVATIAGPVHGDGILVKRGTGSFGTTKVATQGLEIKAGTMAIAAGGTEPSRVQTLSFANSSGSTVGRLDLTNNDMIVDYTGTSPLSTIRQLIQSGKNGANWDGQGITTSLGNIDEAHPRAIGYGEASVATGVSYPGQSIDSTTVVLKYTFTGDATLNGYVDFDDLLMLARNYNMSGKVWTDGDSTYDGVVDFDDLLLEAKNYGYTGSLRPSAMLRSGNTSSRYAGASDGLYELYLELQAGAPWILDDALAHPDGYDLFAPFLTAEGTEIQGFQRAAAAPGYITRLQDYGLSNNLLPEPTTFLGLGLLGPAMLRRRHAR